VLGPAGACRGLVCIRRLAGGGAAEFRQAVNAALSGGVTLAGNMFLGRYEDVECVWDSPLNITAIISSIDLEPIIKAHQAGGRGEPAR
jgi:hypothetical protein